MTSFPSVNPLVLAGIIGLAIRAFMTNKVELNYCFGAAIIAEDLNRFVLKIWRHGSSCNLHVINLPELWHVTNSLGTKSARKSKFFLHILKTAIMNGMATRHNWHAACWLKQILKGNRAVTMHCSFKTRMTFFQLNQEATLAFVAVEVTLLPANSTDTAIHTVKLLFQCIIIK